MAETNKNAKFECHKCKKRLSSKVLLEKHLKRKYPCDADNKCKKCDKEFSNKQNLNRHVNNGCTIYKCKACDKIFIQKHAYDNHLKLCAIESIYELRKDIKKILNALTK